MTRTDYRRCVGFGIAGNFAHHLEQAGEMADFVDVTVDEAHAPKGIFPFYVPERAGMLGTYPLSSDTIRLPKEPCNVQAEPEMAILWDIAYDREGRVSTITPKAFGAYNDCSIRKEGASKISEKKNWGEASKGVAPTLIEMTDFSPSGAIHHYHIASFLRRDGALHTYGEDSPVATYNYFYGTLQRWIITKLNTQQDHGPLEDLGTLLKEAGRPGEMLLAVGATSYTPYGESTYLNDGDELSVVLYDARLYSEEAIRRRTEAGDLNAEGISALVQKVTAP